MHPEKIFINHKNCMRKVCYFICTLSVCCISLSAQPAADWDEYDVGRIVFNDRARETEGSRIYAAVIPDPEAYIRNCAKEVLKTLYFSPSDSIVPVQSIRYELRDYDGISAKSGGGGRVSITYSTRWIEKSFANNDTAKLEYETRGVLYHELTHAYQLEPLGCGTYGDSKVFSAFIEGVADAVRVANGLFTERDRPARGDYRDGYRAAGFFYNWLNNNKDPDFLKKFNRSAIELNPWSFEAAFKHIFGEDEKYSIDNLWNEYKESINNKP